MTTIPAPPADADAKPAQWQPMETAPKDGTQILVWTIHGEVELSDFYRIFRTEYEEVGDGLYRKTKKEVAAEWNSNTPAFWQPLPAPPEGQTPGPLSTLKRAALAAATGGAP